MSCIVNMRAHPRKDIVEEGETNVRGILKVRLICHLKDGWRVHFLTLDANSRRFLRMV